MALLEVESLTKRFGGLTAVDGASFTVEDGDIVGLAGPNGAGKTVTFDLITGQLPPDGGRVVFRGEDITGRPPDAVARAGIGRTFQEVRVYDEMTLRENLLFAAQDKRLGRTLRSLATATDPADAATRDRADDLLEAVDLAPLADDPAASLSFGQRKILAFAAALMTYPEPELIMLDEPMAGVNPTMINELTDYIREFNERGKTFLLVEHNMRLMAELCDRLVVLDAGMPIAAGPPEDVREDDRVIEAYFGE